MNGGDSGGDARYPGTVSTPDPAAAPAPGSQRKWVDAAGGAVVTGGEADLCAHRPPAAGQPTKRHFVARLPEGSVLPPIPA